MAKRLILTAHNYLAGVALRLVLVPFLALQLMAPGTMAASNADGFTIVLCTDGQAVSAILAADGTITPLSETGDHNAADVACIWSLTLDTATDSRPLGDQISSDMLRGTVTQALAKLRFGRLDYARPPARAPPALV